MYKAMSNDLVVLDEMSEFTKEQAEYLIARNKTMKAISKYAVSEIASALNSYLKILLVVPNAETSNQLKERLRRHITPKSSIFVIYADVELDYTRAGGITCPCVISYNVSMEHIAVKFALSRLRKNPRWYTSTYKYIYE